MTSMAEPMCAFCEHRVADGSSKCVAYPDGVPTAITFGGADHRLSLPGDNGVLFVAVSDDAAAIVVADYGVEPELYEGSFPDYDESDDDGEFTLRIE
jgi:hypothetical protein